VRIICIRVHDSIRVACGYGVENTEDVRQVAVLCEVFIVRVSTASVFADELIRKSAIRMGRCNYSISIPSSRW
jgi:tryptophan synthase alpha subunit